MHDLKWEKCLQVNELHPYSASAKFRQPDYDPQAWQENPSSDNAVWNETPDVSNKRGSASTNSDTRASKSPLFWDETDSFDQVSWITFCVNYTPIAVKLFACAHAHYMLCPPMLSSNPLLNRPTAETMSWAGFFYSFEAEVKFLQFLAF